MHARKIGLILWVFLLTATTVSSGQDLKTPKEVFEANIEATGGSEAWNNVKTMYMKMEMVMDIQQMSLIMSTESWVVRPGYLFSKVTVHDAPPEFPAGAGNVTTYITPDEGWVDSFQGRTEFDSLPAAQRWQYESTMHVKEELQRLALPDSMFTMLESEEFDGSMAYVIEMKAEPQARLFYDHDSLLLVGTEMPSPMGGDPFVVRVLDYETIDGLKIAHSIEVDMGSFGFQSMSVRRVELNGDITPESLAAMVEK
ncbi:MAG: hypothetical protein IH853_06415 [Bacteroidetes bacterium]|nr:hypothetical protein [Bacteroidota bacterium]MCH8245804.1 hypothetical protein [Bacteroidota bacterium]